MGKALMAFMAGIIINFDTIVLQDGLRSPSVFETVQMDLYTCRMKEFHLMKKVEHPPVINRVWHVKTHDM